MATSSRVVSLTKTCEAQLAKLPPKVRKGLLDKALELRDTAIDPYHAHKPLTDELEGYYSIKYSRYRALYTVREERPPRGVTSLQIRIVFVAAGIRKDGDKKDVYRLATRLMKLGALLPPDE